MRILMMTLGTQGDLEQMLALGLALQRRGHDVLVASSAFYSERVWGCGLNFIPVGHGTLHDLWSVLDSLSDLPMSQRARAFFRNWLWPQWQASQDLVLQLADTSDFFVDNLHLLLGREGHALPSASLLYDLPSDLQGLRKSLAQPGACFRQQLVALPADLTSSNDWPREVAFTGFFAANPAPPMSRALTEFLGRGTAPIVLTMGSMRSFDNFQLANMLHTTLMARKQRGIVVGAWSGIEPNADAEHILHVDSAPYDELFQRCQAVIHHGGTGTTAATLRAGIPSIVVPFLDSQRLLGECLVQRGYVAALLDRASLNSELLQDALDRSMLATSEREACQAYAAQHRPSGAEHAADLIEAHARYVDDALQAS